MKNHTELVESVLRDFPETRDSLKSLLLKVWEIQGLKLSEEQKIQFMRCTDPITLRRRQQEIQNDGWRFRPNSGEALKRTLFSTGKHL